MQEKGSKQLEEESSVETIHEKCESCIAIHFAVMNRYMILSFGTFLRIDSLYVSTLNSEYISKNGGKIA